MDKINLDGSNLKHPADTKDAKGQIILFIMELNLARMKKQGGHESLNPSMTNEDLRVLGERATQIIALRLERRDKTTGILNSQDLREIAKDLFDAHNQICFSAHDECFHPAAPTHKQEPF